VDTAARSSLLVVEDDADVADAVRAALTHAGHDVRVVSNGDAAVALCASWTPDLVVLDVNLPGMDGFDTCRAIRRTDADVPVIFLTARRELDDLRRAFDGGGDDYLTKPFSVEELNIRIDAALRRRSRGSAVDDQRLAGGPVVLDADAHQVWVHGQETHFTPTEFRMLHHLMANSGRALHRDQIIDYVWRYEFDGDPRVVETYVAALRRKLGDRDATLIHTVRGHGYRFDGARP
jgi:two-component system OmpR family response regulator